MLSKQTFACEHTPSFREFNINVTILKVSTCSALTEKPGRRYFRFRSELHLVAFEMAVRLRFQIRPPAMEHISNMGQLKDCPFPESLLFD